MLPLVNSSMTGQFRAEWSQRWPGPAGSAHPCSVPDQCDPDGIKCKFDGRWNGRCDFDKNKKALENKGLVVLVAEAVSSNKQSK